MKNCFLWAPTVSATSLKLYQLTYKCSQLSFLGRCQRQALSLFTQITLYSTSRAGRLDQDRHWTSLASKNLRAVNLLSLPKARTTLPQDWHVAQLQMPWVPVADWAFLQTVLTSTEAPPTPPLTDCLSWQVLISNKAASSCFSYTEKQLFLRRSRRQWGQKRTLHFQMTRERSQMVSSNGAIFLHSEAWERTDSGVSASPTQ